MAHYAKYKKGAIGVLTRHFERRKDAQGEYVKFGNQDIDTSLSHRNYNLGPERDNQVAFIHERCGEVKCLNRSDVTVMCSWVVTAPEPRTWNETAGTANYSVGFHQGRYKEFFEQAYEFLANRYGEENVISSYVHMDETSPHMHFSFVPVTTDKKTGLDKVAASEKVNRMDLQTFHGDLEKHMRNHFKFDIGVLNEATKGGNKTVKELKNNLFATKQSETALKSSLLAQEVKELTELRERLQREIEWLRSDFINIKVPTGEKSITGKKVSFTKEDAEKLIGTAEKFYRQQLLLEEKTKQCKFLENDIAELKTSKVMKDYEALKAANKSSRFERMDELITVRARVQYKDNVIEKLMNRLQIYEKIINNNPALFDYFESEIEKSLSPEKQNYHNEKSYEGFEL